MGRAKTEKFPMFAGFSLDPKTNKMSAGYIIGISIKPSDFGLTGGEDNATMAAAVVRSLEAQGAAAATARAEAAEQRAAAAERLSDRYGVFVQECGFLADIEVYSPDDLPLISERLGALRARAEAAEQRAEAAEREVAQAQTERERARVDACLMLSLAWALDAPMLIGACFINGAYTAEIDALRGLCETTIAADRPGDLLAAIRRVLHHEATAVRGSPACVAAVARWEVSDE